MKKVFMHIGVMEKSKKTKNRWKIVQNEDIDVYDFVSHLAYKTAVLAAEKIGFLSLKKNRQDAIFWTAKKVMEDEISKIIKEDR